MQWFMHWMQGLPIESLYALVATAAFLEGVAPPVPGDVAAAFLSFLAARSGGTWLLTTLFITTGSVGGAMVMWGIGYRYGAEWLTGQLHRLGLSKAEAQVDEAEHRIEDAYRKYGWVALFVSRFLPGVRAVVPAAAGALKVPFWETFTIFAVASGLWYGAIAWVAFKVGNDWESVKLAMTALARDVGLGAIVLAAILGLIGWRLWRRRSQASRTSE